MATPTSLATPGPVPQTAQQFLLFGTPNHPPVFDLQRTPAQQAFLDGAYRAQQAQRFAPSEA